MLIQHKSVSKLKMQCVISWIHTNLPKPESHIIASATSQKMQLYWSRTCADIPVQYSAAIWIYRIKHALA